jgi:hypothetical protein
LAELYEELESVAEQELIANEASEGFGLQGIGMVEMRKSK